MRIERISDNKLRVELNKSDLDSRNLRLSELAYGSQKAKALFEELMSQASFDYGFDTEDGPYMIEAIPTSSESITLLVTKMDSFDELDTRFSRFSSFDSDEEFAEEEIPFSDLLPEFSESAADDVLNLFKRLTKTSPEESVKNQLNAGNDIDITKMFVFDSLDNLIALSAVLNPIYNGQNTVYKNTKTDNYYLILSKSSTSPQVFNKACNIISEYANQDNFSIGTDTYMDEHYKLLVRNNAIESFAQLA